MQKFWRTGILLLLMVGSTGLPVSADDMVDEDVFMFRPPTLVNLDGHPDYKLLMLKFNLYTDTLESAKRLEYHQPLLHHHLMMMLTTEDPMLIASSNGKAYVKERVLAKINEVLMGETGQSGVTDLKFLQFILE